MSDKSIQNKGIFLVGEYIIIIENAHNNYFIGFAEINYRLVISYSLNELKYLIIFKNQYFYFKI